MRALAFGVDERKYVMNRLLLMRSWLIRSGDRGQTAAEYMGIVVIVAIIIVAIATSNIGQTIADNITNKITEIFGAGG
jgi:pilus assembly protein Flp/PilA